MKRILCLLVAVIAIGAPRLHADNRFRNGDIFEMRVSGPPDEVTREFSVTLVVDEGSVNLPMIGRIAAAGMSSTQLAISIERRLREAKIFTVANVNITPVRDVNPQRAVIVSGAVRTQGRQAWTQDLTLMGAIAAAGGASEFRKDGIKIIRGGRATSYSWKAISKNPASDPKVEVGDIIVQEGD